MHFITFVLDINSRGCCYISKGQKYFSCRYNYTKIYNNKSVNFCKEVNFDSLKS